MILLLDFEKAFDSLEWVFIIRVLERLNFGKSFVQWIKCIYSQPCAIIKNNGWLSGKLYMKRGIKQGCPLSALLFILAAEILSLNIKKCNLYKGLGIKERNIKILQYADDTIVFPKSDSEISIIINHLKIFSDVAGPKLNISKTEGMRLGNLKYTRSKYTDIQWNNKCIRCLGIYVGLDKIECEKRNWIDKIEQLQRLLDNWRSRKLTIFGKVQVIKSLALSKLVFSAINTYMPTFVCKSVNKIIYSFIWNKKDRIKRSIAISPVIHGGLNMLDIHSFFASLKATWVNRIFSNLSATWCHIGITWLEMLGPIEFVFNTNTTNIGFFTVKYNIPLFYEQVINSYNSSKIDTRPTNLDELKQQVIWCNEFITIYVKGKKSHQPLYFKHWIDKGIFYIQDLPIISGRIDIQSTRTMLDSHPSYLIDSNKLQLALKPYRDLIYETTFHQIEEQNTFVVQTCNKSKALYLNIVQGKREIASLKQISIETDIQMSKPLLEKIFKRKVITMEIQKIAEFNYKVLHNILACGALISKWDKEVNENCDICNEKETGVHILWSCNIAQYVWKSISNAMDINITKSDILIGSNMEKEYINLILSQISYVLYKYRLQSWENKFTRTTLGIRNILKAELRLNHDLFRHMKKFNYCNIICELYKVL